MPIHTLRRVSLLALVVLGALAIYSSAAAAAGPPIVTIGSANELSLNTATVNGTIESNGATTTYKVEYGHSKLYGSSTLSRSMITTTAKYVLTGLDPLSIYHARIKATNKYGTTVSGDLQFELPYAWYVDGKSLVDLESEYQPEVVTRELSGDTFSVKGKIGLTKVEVLCSEVGGYSKIWLGSEAKMLIGQCKLSLNGGSVAKACEPQGKGLKLLLGPNLNVVGEQSLTLGTGECSIGNKIDFTGGGAAIGPMAEHNEQPIEMIGSLPATPELNFYFNSKNMAMTGFYLHSVFGIH